MMRKLEGQDDLSLLRATAETDAAFAVFYRRHVDAVLRLCARRGLGAQDAADATAETFAAALQSRMRYRAKGDSARGWLLGIAEHKVAECRRRGRRELRLVGRLAFEPIELSPRDYADYAELVASMTDTTASDALGGLPDGERDAVHARVVVGEGYDVIAERLEINEVLARQRVSRGLAALRARLTKEYQ
jgi:RNA polymerase sigma-70 factor (ECF subfamily)